MKVKFRDFVDNHSKLIIYMGLSQLKNISEQLIKAGKNRKTRVKIVTNISLDSEKTINSDLGGCLKAKENFGLKPPAIIIID